MLGNLLHDEAVRGVVFTAHDVTERRVLEDQLKHQAFHDALTGLPNRALLDDRVEHALERARRSRDVAVLFLDLDDFKTINDSLGHAAGDDLLVEMASRLHESLRSVDTAARLGRRRVRDGARGHERRRRCDGVAERVLDGDPAVRCGRQHRGARRASVGIVFGTPGSRRGELLRNADMAMYRAKRSGGTASRSSSPRCTRRRWPGSS